MPCYFPVTLPDGHFPCGRCPFCLERRVDGWSFRLRYHERSAHSISFLTFTYSDGNCDVTQNNFLTLNKSHMQLFWKRLRKDMGKLGLKLQYYMCGEYGGETQRPHYHAVCFNIPKEWLSRMLLYRYWYDADTGEIRGNIDYGYSQIGDDFIGYVVGYTCKERIVGKYRRDDRVKEYTACSNGLGLDFVKNNSEFYNENLRQYITLIGGKKIYMPRYYQEKIFSAGERRMLSAIRQEVLKDVVYEPEVLEIMQRCGSDLNEANRQMWSARNSATKNYFYQKKLNRNKL